MSSLAYAPIDFGVEEEVVSKHVDKVKIVPPQPQPAAKKPLLGREATECNYIVMIFIIGLIYLTSM